MKPSHSVVFLVDVDDTLLENDRVQEDIKAKLEQQYGPRARDRYWEVQERIFTEVGYRDYLGALQRYRFEYPLEPCLFAMASFLVDYPFADRLYPGALAALDRLRGLGRTVILTDGDMAFQPRKLDRSGLFAAVDGHVLIYVHKEKSLPDIERLYPAEHYILVDDKLRILAAVKDVWGQRVTTVFVRQGQFANDPAVIHSCPPADLTIDRIQQLSSFDLVALSIEKAENIA